MEIAEYYDSIAFFWDNDYSETKPARMAAATLSIPRGGGACVLDIGCGSGSMFYDLLEAGAFEIDGLDISKAMIQTAREKYDFDPRIHLGNVIKIWIYVFATFSNNYTSNAASAVPPFITRSTCLIYITQRTRGFCRDGSGVSAYELRRPGLRPGRVHHRKPRDGPRRR